ncbi:MAG: prolipoprotein diacylglyceryl transferase [bacterium]
MDGDLRFTIPTYFVALMTGFILAARLGWKDAEPAGFQRKQYADFVIWLLIVGIAGGRLLHVLVDGFLMDYVHLCTDPFLLDGRWLPTAAPCISNMECLAAQQTGRDIGAICNPADGLCYPVQDCFRWLKFWAGGLTVYGSLLGCAAFTYFYGRKHELNIARLLDMGGYGIPLGIAIGRLGCFAAGCCYGNVCDVSTGIRFPIGSPAYNEHFDHHYAELSAQWAQGIQASLPVWPTQLISSAYAFAIFAFVLFWLRPRKKFDGQLILVMGMLYATARFLVEFLRADPRGEALGLSTSQLIAVGTVAFCVWMYRRLSATKNLPST